MRRTFIAAITALALAGCGSDGDGDSGSDAAKAEVIAAAEKTVAAGTAVLDQQVSGGLTAEQSLKADFGSDRAAGTISFGDDAPGGLAGLSGEMYVDGRDTYMRFPDLPSNGDWQTVPQSPTGALQNQPTALLDSLEPALTNVVKTSSDADGAEYEGDFEVAAIVDASELTPEEQAAMNVPISVTISVGPEGLLESYDMAVGDGGVLRVDTDLSQIGEPVDIGPRPNGLP